MTDDVLPAVKRRRRRALMADQKRIVARRHRNSIGTEVQVMVDGPSPEHELVMQGRLESQAPEIDSRVYFSDSDSSRLRPGELIHARILRAEDYDLVVTPLPHN